VDWRPQHPVLKYVNMIQIFASKVYKMDWPRTADILAEFSETPAVALLNQEGSTYLFVPFDILDSNWPFEPGFILFWYNTIAYMSSQADSGLQYLLQTGDPILIDGVAPGTDAAITDPLGITHDLQASQNGQIRFARTHLAGLYEVSMNQKSLFYAVNLLNEHESRIQPVDTLTVTGDLDIQGNNTIRKANIPVWPWLILASFIIVCLEWWIYTSKIRL
jgi:hypothetical protein